MAEVHRGRRCFCEALGEYLASLGLSPGQIEELQAAAQAQRRCLQSVVRPLTGVRTTLRELHQSGITLAVLCNSEQPGDAMRQWLERFGMGQCFRAVISSIDLGQAMPDPASYGAALRAMQLPARRVAFVGHSAVELAGAAALGMTTVAFNRDADARADLVIDRFEDLLKWLRPWPVPPPLEADATVREAHTPPNAPTTQSRGFLIPNPQSLFLP